MSDQIINLNDTLPAAAAGKKNVTWQADAPSGDSTVVRKVSAQTNNIGGVVVKMGNYTAVAADMGLLIVMNGTGLTLTLPAAPPSADWWIGVANINSSAATVSRNGLNIDGAAANLSLTQGQSARISTDNANYFSERGAGSSGSVTAVTASAPLASSGGATPDISLPNVHGNGSKVQMSDNTGVNGNYAKWDANGNVTDSGVPAPSGSGAIAIAFTTPAGTVNLSTLGTRDWFALGSAATPRLLETITTTQVSLHRKALGDSVMMLGFDWVWAGNASGSIGTGSTMGYTLATTAADDTATAALSSNAFNTNMGKGASATGFGFSIRVPADTFSRVLYIFGGPLIVGASGTVTAQVTAHLSDGSHVDVTDSQSATGSGASNIGRWGITYNSARDGQTMVVTVLVTVNSAASTGKLVFAAAALA